MASRKKAISCQLLAVSSESLSGSLDKEVNSRLLKSQSNKAAGEAKPEAYPLGYVEDLADPRTQLDGFFSSRLSVRARPLRIELLQPIDQGLSLWCAGTRWFARWMVPRQLRNACFGE
jgi:hypothetical protein